jgi:hypothetical protein
MSTKQVKSLMTAAFKTKFESALASFDTSDNALGELKLAYFATAAAKQEPLWEEMKEALKTHWESKGFPELTVSQKLTRFRESLGIAPKGGAAKPKPTPAPDAFTDVTCGKVVPAEKTFELYQKLLTSQAFKVIMDAHPEVTFAKLLTAVGNQHKAALKAAKAAATPAKPVEEVL